MRGAVPLIGLALAAAPLAAQNECSGLFDPALRPGCELAVDAYHTAQRVGGIAISGVPLGVGYGARIGIMNGRFPIPTVSVSVMRRTLPRLYFGDLPSGDHFAFDSDLKATNVRITAGMRLLALDVAAGIGFDHYSGTAHLRWGTYGIRTAEIGLPATSSPRALFADAGLTLP